MSNQNKDIDTKMQEEREKIQNKMADGEKSASEQFARLPIESLICKSISAAAKEQQELTNVYIDGIKKLAYKEGGTKKDD